MIEYVASPPSPLHSTKLKLNACFILWKCTQISLVFVYVPPTWPLQVQKILGRQIMPMSLQQDTTVNKVLSLNVKKFLVAECLQDFKLAIAYNYDILCVLLHFWLWKFFSYQLRNQLMVHVRCRPLKSDKAEVIYIKRRSSVTNLSLENNLPMFWLNGPVVIRAKVKEMWTNVAIYSHALPRIHIIGGKKVGEGTLLLPPCLLITAVQQPGTSNPSSWLFASLFHHEDRLDNNLYNVSMVTMRAHILHKTWFRSTSAS